MSLLDQIVALLRWKRLILVNTLIVAAASVVVALLLPKWYQSTASVFPPEEEALPATSLSGLMSVASLAAGRSSLPLLASPSDVLAAVLESRSVSAEIIERFDLLRVYKADTMEDALESLGRNVRIRVGSEGVVRVRVLDKSAQRAADMANAYVELLDRVNREKRNVSARQAREFIERRLAQNRVELAAAEDSLRSLQERTGAVLPEEQVRTLIASAADAQAELLLREVDLSVLRAQVGPDHPDLRALERQVDALRDRLREVEERSSGAANRVRLGRMLELPLERYPELTLAYVRALRDVRVQEALFELLTEQYERYRIQESRDTPTVQVLDRAVPADRKTKPIRWLICVSATGAAFLLSLLLAAALEAVVRTRREDPGRYDRLRRLFGEFGLSRALDRL